MVGRPDIDETIRRLRAYAEAGADCLYAPRIDNVEYVVAIVAAVSPKPVNLLINAPFMTVTEAANLGVRRISVGGTLARTAWRGFLQAATEIAETGTFSEFEQLPNVDGLLSHQWEIRRRLPGPTGHLQVRLPAMGEDFQERRLSPRPLWAWVMDLALVSL